MNIKNEQPVLKVLKDVSHLLRKRCSVVVVSPAVCVLQDDGKLNPQQSLDSYMFVKADLDEVPWNNANEQYCTQQTHALYGYF